MQEKSPQIICIIGLKGVMLGRCNLYLGFVKFYLMFIEYFCSVVMQSKMLNNIPFVFTTTEI